MLTASSPIRLGWVDNDVDFSVLVHRDDTSAVAFEGDKRVVSMVLVDVTCEFNGQGGVRIEVVGVHGRR